MTLDCPMFAGHCDSGETIAADAVASLEDRSKAHSPHGLQREPVPAE
jgi:hypothetical protein